MREYIGFSTGALALGNFDRALSLLRNSSANAVELSALREAELAPLLSSIRQLSLTQFDFVSVHAPASFDAPGEERITQQLAVFADRGWPVIMHPEAIHDFQLWKKLGETLCLENMDQRKLRGRTVAELEWLFQQLPEAGFCFDIGHAHQIDPTMSHASSMLRRFGERLVQVHISEVNAASHHCRLTGATISAYRKVAHLIPGHVPLIIESPVPASDIAAEMKWAESALQPLPQQQPALGSDGLRAGTVAWP